MIKKGYFGLNRLGLGVRYQSDRAARWGWNRYCHTYMKSEKSLWEEIHIPTIGIETELVKYTLDNWVKDQRKEAPAGDLKRILLKLRKDGLFSQALKVFEWMSQKGIYKFSPSDHAVLINLIWRVRGCSAAECHVRNLPKEAINDKTYGELLHCYVHEHRTQKALMHFQKMKRLGFASSPRPFNEIMHLYAKSRQIDKVLGVLAELKKSKVSPDNDSYRICISSFGLKYDLDGMERMLREMETQPHIIKDWCTYAVVANFYEREFLVDKATEALKKAEVILQKEGLVRSSNYLMNIDYEIVIKSLVKLGELDEAMKFVKEWVVLGNWRSVDDISIPCTIIEEYVKNGGLGAALYSVQAWGREKVGLYKLSRILCNEYVKVGDLMAAACKCFRVPAVHDGIYIPAVQRLFFQYLEEDCGSFFPLCCSTRSCCTRSLKTDMGVTFLELTPINVEYKYKVALLVHPENSTTQAVNMDYENSIKSLVESGELNEARKMAIEWEESGNLSSLDDLNISKLIIDGYCKKSLFVEAEAMAEAWTRERKCWVVGIWLILACHYQEQGKMVRGFECMRRFSHLTPTLKGDYFTDVFDMFVYIIEFSRGIKARDLPDYNVPFQAEQI